jgi:hypothetical protein
LHSTKAVELYGIPQAGLAAIPAIDAGFKFAAAESDQELNFLHVEALFEGASKFLDRCQELRARRDSLQLEKWKLQLDLDRFFRLDQLQTRELQAGAETLPYERALLESAAPKSLEENHRNSEAQLLLEHLIASGFNKRMSARELTAWLLPYPLKDREHSGDDAAYTFDGACRSKPDHLFEAARIEQDQAAWEQVHTLMMAPLCGDGGVGSRALEEGKP